MKCRACCNQRACDRSAGTNLGVDSKSRPIQSSEDESRPIALLNPRRTTWCSNISLDNRVVFETRFAAKRKAVWTSRSFRLSLDREWCQPR
jgi:hypothetical protein